MRPIIILLPLLLSSCSAYEERQAAERRYQESATLQAADEKCRSYGVIPGSPGYVQCRINLDNQAAADEQQRRALAASYLLRR